MRVEILLPDLYRVMTGRKKKMMAWAYLQRYYPAHVPLPVQEKLETDNVLICDIDFVRQRQITAEINARRAANKPKTGRKKK